MIRMVENKTIYLFRKKVKFYLKNNNILISLIRNLSEIKKELIKCL
jgi:hypothetical protein